jgi:hypothetical protein
MLVLSENATWPCEIFREYFLDCHEAPYKLPAVYAEGCEAV